MVKIFYCDIFDTEIDKTLIDKLPSSRKSYVENFKDENRKKQSLFVWLLLEYVMRFYNVDISTKTVIKNINGAWEIQDCGLSFSLSHSKNIVVVAISEFQVGVDVEICSSKILKIKSKLNTNKNDISDLTKLWVEKECVIKVNNKNAINICYHNVFDKFNNEYVIGVLSVEKENHIYKVDISNLKN